MNPSTAPVVFVCTGNICRSPLAERLAAHLDPHTSFASAGTHAMVGSDMDAGMAAELSRLGGDPSDFSPRLIDAQASILCRRIDHHPFGTHSIFIGVVEEVSTRDGVDPLVYLDGRYGSVGN